MKRFLWIGFVILLLLSGCGSPPAKVDDVISLPDSGSVKLNFMVTQVENSASQGQFLDGTITATLPKGATVLNATQGKCSLDFAYTVENVTKTAHWGRKSETGYCPKYKGYYLYLDGPATIIAQE